MMKLTTLFLTLLILCGCGGEPPHLRKIRRKVDRVGAANMLADARSLVTRYESPVAGRSTPYIRLDATGCLTNFGTTARVKSAHVSMTTAGLGSTRAGISTITTTEMPSWTTNMTQVASGIYYWAGKR